jgi:hypothetical protein
LKDTGIGRSRFYIKITGKDGEWDIVELINVAKRKELVKAP